MLKVENSRVRAEQLAKLYELRSSRDRVRVDAALAELSAALRPPAVVPVLAGSATT